MAEAADQRSRLRKRNKLLKEHLQVVLHEDDTVLYSNSMFTSQLKTKEESTLRSERQKYLKELKTSLEQAETAVAVDKITQHFGDRLATTQPVLLKKLFQDCLGFTPQTFTDLYALNLHAFAKALLRDRQRGANSEVQPLGDFFPALLRDTSSVDDWEDDDLVGGGGDDDGDGVGRALFGDGGRGRGSSLWGQNRLCLCLGLVLYRILAQTPITEHEAALGRFRQLFFEVSDALVGFFASLWELDDLQQQRQQSASGTAREGAAAAEDPRAQSIRDRVHTLHLQGALRTYFSVEQLQRLFHVTRGPYVSAEYGDAASSSP